MKTKEQVTAETIVEQMGIVRLMIGARKFLALDATDGRRGGVRFHVGRGNWYVDVEHSFLDLYDVRFKTRKSNRVGYEMTDVYAEDLPEVLIQGGDACNI